MNEKVERWMVRKVLDSDLSGSNLAEAVKLATDAEAPLEAVRFEHTYAHGEEEICLVWYRPENDAEYAARQAREIVNAKAQEARDRAQYEELKKRFGR